MRWVLCTTGSVASLCAGLVFGILAGVGAYLTTKNPHNVWLSLGEDPERGLFDSIKVTSVNHCNNDFSLQL